MKVVQINTTCGLGSTGKICVSISRLLSEKNIENYIFYAADSDGYNLGVSYMNCIDIKVQALKSRIFGNYGFNTKKATRKLIKKIEKINPDIVQLHNLHGHNCNIEMLFSYFKRKNIKIFWTFHDCWAFTGYCPHFDMIGCQEWKKGCRCCPQKKKYSWFFDRSKEILSKKNTAFSGLNLTIITPSKWLASLVRESFLKDYPVQVINNGIDLSVFKPKESNFKREYGCEDKIILLGVAYDWSNRKGLDIFVELAGRLDDKYKIVLIGTNKEVDKLLPDNIISIHRLKSSSDLVSVYSAADIFLNPSREENFPTVNIEALACGVPVLTFNTGGSPEAIDETCGVVVQKDDITALENEIYNIIDLKTYTKENCISRVRIFNENDRFHDYLKLYGVDDYENSVYK